MAAPKCRIDVWQPTILNVATTGGTIDAQLPPMWVKCDTVTDVTTENPPGPNPNLRRANACTSVEIKDEMFSPRIAYISIANRPQDFTAFDTDTMETQHQDSDGNSIALTAGGSAVKTRIRRNWGPFSFFFKEFQQIRIVDLETHLVLFTGRIYKVSKKHDGQRGATVELICKDALEELQNLSMKTMPKELHFPADTERSTVVQGLLNLGFNYEASLPAGGTGKNQTSPVTTVLSSATLAINSNDAAASAGANSYSRFELSATAPDTVTKVKTRKTGSKHLLSELTRWAILEPHEDETAENQFGYDFFVDPNIGSDNLLATTAPPPAMFNYFKRGNRLSAAGGAGQDADTYGLTCILPTVARAAHTGLQQSNVGTTAASGNTTIDYFAVNANHSLYPGQLITIGSETMYVKFVANANDEGGEEEVYVVRGWGGSTPASFSSNAAIVENRPATAVMQKDTSSFEDAKDELFTECSLTYDTSYFIGTKKFGTKEKTKKFEIMFATEISGNFAWAGLDFDDDSAPADADTPGTHSAEFVSAYREDGEGGSPTLIAATVGRIQYQSTSTNTGATNFGYIMLSDITQNFPTANYSGEDYIVLKGHTAPYRTCRVNCNATEAQQGRPSLAFAGGTTELKRGFSMTKETHDNIDDIRQEIAARLGQSTIAMKRGDFLVSKAPYYWADFKVRSVSADGSTGQILTVKSDNGTAAVKVTNYGFREGMLTHKRDDADGNPDYRYIATANGNDVYGYCYSMTADDTFRVNLTESQSFAVDDKIRLFIPIRAGEAIFVDHILATVYGEHLTTAVNFNEMPAPTTSYSTIGENEPRIRMRVGSVNRQNIWNTIAVDRLEASEREHPNLPKGTQTFSFGGTWSYPANNVVAWTAGDLRTSDGEVYQIAADDTSDATYGLNGVMTGSNKYIVYLDPEGENPSGNIYHLYTIISTAYVEDDDNIIVLAASVGDALADASAGPNLDLVLTDAPSQAATKNIHVNTATSALLKKGAQHWSTNVKFEGTDYNIARWGLSTSIGSDGAISFGDDGTEVVTRHTGYTFAAGTSWVYKTVGSSAVALPVVTQTYSDVTRADSDRILMATVVVDSDVGQGSPTIFPVNGNTPTISVGALAARSILATNIKAGSITASEIEAGTITTNQLDFTYASDINGNSGLNSDTTASIRAVAAATSGAVAGLQVSAATFHMGTGTFGNANTPFFVRGVNEVGGANGTAGDFSLGNKFIWDNSASALTLEGVLTFGGTCTISSTGINFPNAADNNNGGTITWNYGGNETFIYREGNGKKLMLTHNGSSPSDGAMWVTGMDFRLVSTGADYYKGVTSLAPLYGGLTSDADSLHTHGSFGSGSGDITAVVAGGGLTGGATSGSATLAINYSTNHSYGSGYTIDAGNFRSTLNSTTNSGLYAQGSPGQFNKGMWISDETAPSSPNSGFIRLYSESNVLKYKKSNGNIVNISSGSTGSGVIGTADQFSIPIYSNQGSDEEVGNSNWEIISGGSLLTPKNDGTQTVGVLYQSGGVDVGIKGFAGWEAAVAGNPPFTFANKSSTGMSVRTVGGSDYVNFESADVDIFRVGNGQCVIQYGGLVPSANGTKFIGSYTTNVWTPSFSQDMRFASGNFHDFSTKRKAHFHYGVGQATEVQGGHGISSDASRVHITCPLYYDNVHVAFAPPNEGGETTVDMEIITYANNNQHKMVRAASSARFKDNIRDLEIDTSKIWDLQPRSFEWRGDGTTAFGLIAEEVDEIIPGLVAKYAHGSDEVMPQSVHYKFLSVLLLAEMKELKARIEELEKE